MVTNFVNNSKENYWETIFYNIYLYSLQALLENVTMDSRYTMSCIEWHSIVPICM